MNLTKNCINDKVVCFEYTLALSVKINFNNKSYFTYKLLVLKIRFAYK